MTDDRPLVGRRVLHLSSVHRLSDPRIRLKQCRTLAAAGAEVTLVARSSPVEVDPDNIETVELTDYPSRFARIGRGLVDLIREARRHRADLIHIHDPELLLIAPALRVLAGPVIYDVHESLPDLVLNREWIPRAARRLVSRATALIEPLLARACSGYVLVDQSWAPRFADRPWVEVANPPLVDEFADLERRANPALPHVVYVGELLPERGVHGAVEAINRLDAPARLTLAGPVAPDLAAELRSLDHRGRLDLPGLLARRQVGELLASATVGLVLLEPVPAYDDATATKIFEYLAAGLPMILSDTTAHRRIASTTGAGDLVAYGDVDGLTESIERLADPETNADFSKRASEAAAIQPTWADVAPALVDFYRHLT